MIERREFVVGVLYFSFWSAIRHPVYTALHSAGWSLFVQRRGGNRRSAIVERLSDVQRRPGRSERAKRTICRDWVTIWQLRRRDHLRRSGFWLRYADGQIVRGYAICPRDALGIAGEYLTFDI